MTEHPAAPTPLAPLDQLFNEVDERFGRNVARFVDARLDAALAEARAAARKEVRPAMWELVHDAAHAGNGYYETCMECMRSVDAILDSLSTDTREEHGDAD